MCEGTENVTFLDRNANYIRKMYKQIWIAPFLMLSTKQYQYGFSLK